MRNCAILLILAVLAACGGPAKQSTETASPQATEARLPPQIPPVEFGHIQPGKPMTSANMPYFDTVKYCEYANRSIDKTPRGPHYEACVEDQHHTKLIMGQAIDAKQYKEDLIIHCAKATRTAYMGMWYCMNGQDFR